MARSIEFVIDKRPAGGEHFPVLRAEVLSTAAKKVGNDVQVTLTFTIKGAKISEIDEVTIPPGKCRGRLMLKSGDVLDNTPALLTELKIEQDCDLDTNQPAPLELRFTMKSVKGKVGGGAGS